MLRTKVFINLVRNINFNQKGAFFSTSQMIHSKYFDKIDDAIADVKDGSTILMGGFGLSGIPENLISALKRKGTRDLTCVSNNVGLDDFGIGLLLKDKQIKRMMASYVGENKEFEKQFLNGQIELEFIPQGIIILSI